MNKEEFKELKKIYNDLYERKIYAYYLDILDEIDCQLEVKLTEDDLCKLFNIIKNTYLDLDSVSIWALVRCAIDNLEEVLNGKFNLKERVYDYEV